jgi:hypothetical protein
MRGAAEAGEAVTGTVGWVHQGRQHSNAESQMSRENQNEENTKPTNLDFLGFLTLGFP